MNLAESFKRIFGRPGQRRSARVNIAADELLDYVFSLVNREDLVIPITDQRTAARRLPPGEREKAYIPIYTALENFITANQPLVVKEDLTRAQLREKVRSGFALEKIGDEFALIFLPPAGQRTAFYRVILAQIVGEVAARLGTARTTDMVRNAAAEEKTPNKIFTRFSRDLSRLIGPEAVEELWRRIYESYQHAYPADLVRAFLDLAPEAVLEKERLALLSKEELETIHQQLLKEKLRTEEERDKTKILLESIGDSVVAIDRTTNVLLWNEAAERLTGWHRGEVVGQPVLQFLKFIREEDHKEAADFIFKALRLNEVRTLEVNTLLIRRDGTEVFVSCNASPVIENGLVTGAIVAFRDISRERELEQTRQELSSLAIHQLRTPITIIKWNTESLNEEWSSMNEHQRDAMKNIEQAAESLNTLVNTMLNVSRIESGTIAVVPESCDLPEILDGVVEELSAGLQEKGIALHKKYADKIPSINADRNLLMAIMRNLLSNAAKYTAPGGSVTVGIQPQHAEVVISITDTGVGIPKGQQYLVFGKFFRADNVRAVQIGSTGLGLYIVKKILDQAGGRVWFESTENKGTTFFVALPLSGMKERQGLKGLT